MIVHYATGTDELSSEEEPQSQADMAFTVIRADIINGNLAPGARLRLEELRGKYDIGFGPIRESLMRLQSEGFVVLEQRKGFRVASASLNHLLDVTRVRIELECLSLKWSIDHGDLGWEARIVASFHRLSKQQKHVPPHSMSINEQWIKEHREFHAALVAGCDSPTLSTIRDWLFDQAVRYVSLSAKSVEKEQDVRVDSREHEEIMQATLDRNTKLACNLMTSHIERTMQKVAAFYERMDTR